MGKKILAVYLFICIIFPFSSCAEKAPTVILPNEGGVARGQIGDVMRAPLLDFTVTDAKALSQYEQMDPIEGDKYIVVLITLTNTGSTPVTLQDTDFQLQWGNNGFTDPLTPYADKMAPIEATLGAGESVKYHYLYSVATIVTDFTLCYLSQPAEGGEPQIFYVSFIV